MKNNNRTLGIGKKILVSRKRGAWLVLALLLVISAAPARAGYSATLIAGDEPKVGTGG